MARVDSKYALVIAASRRARELMAGAGPLVDTDATKPVTIALQEIAAGRLDIVLSPVATR